MIKSLASDWITLRTSSCNLENTTGFKKEEEEGEGESSVALGVEVPFPSDNGVLSYISKSWVMLEMGDSMAAFWDSDIELELRSRLLLLELVRLGGGLSESTDTLRFNILLLETLFFVVAMSEEIPIEFDSIKSYLARAKEVAAKEPLISYFCKQSYYGLIYLFCVLY